MAEAVADVAHWLNLVLDMFAVQDRGTVVNLPIIPEMLTVLHEVS